jgi:hypothetical protein
VSSRDGWCVVAPPARRPPIRGPLPQGWSALGYCGRQAEPDAPAPPTTPAADRALQELNYSKINDKPIRLMWSLRDPNARKTTAANIFIKVRHRATQGDTHRWWLHCAHGNWVEAHMARVRESGSLTAPPPLSPHSEPGRVH